MARKLDTSWVVYKSLENEEHDRCVDIFFRPDGSYGFEEFRKDPEDGGSWWPVAHYSDSRFDNEAAVLAAARRAILWFAPSMDRSALQKNRHGT